MKHWIPINKNIDNKLVEGLLFGNAEIIRNLYRKHLPVVQRMVAGYPLIAPGAEAILQEGLARTMVDIRTGRYYRQGSVSSHLNGICRHLCRQEHLKAKQADPDTVTAMPAVEREGHYFELLDLLLGAKNGLEQQYREILAMRYMPAGEPGSYPLKEKPGCFKSIARQLKIKEETARQRFFKCQEKLIEIVNGAPELEDFLENG